MLWENRLFGEQSISDYIHEIKDAAKKYIESQDEDYILNVNEKEFQDYLYNLYSRHKPIINEEEIFSSKEVSEGEKYVVLNVPFEGNQKLFECIPTTSRINYYPVGIEGNLLKIKIPLTENSQNIKKETNSKIDTLKYNLDNLEKDLQKFNSELKEFIKKKFDEKKQKIIEENETITSLGFPLKERGGVPKNYVVPDVKGKISIEKPKATKKGFLPEPVISDEDYENILKIIDNMSKVMEFSPSVFNEIEEEDLRTHFLVQLNGQYEGRATGETFNLEGKTDICIKEKGKNIFIAECKYWHGEEAFIQAIDQLLRYVSWRDTKTAIILFNKNKEFSKVLSQIPEIVGGHKNFKTYKKEYGDETTFRFIMKNKDDADKDFTLTVKCYNIPKNESP